MSKKITRSAEVALDYSRYEEICHSEKSIASRDISLDEVTSHPGTLQQIVAVHREIDGVEMSMDVRGHWQNVADYSVRLFDKNFMRCAIGRLDIVGKPHDNLSMGVPMQKLRVRTPHFHKFDSNGYEYAYRTQVIDTHESLMRDDRSFGLRCFLDEENIKYDGDVSVSSNSLIQPTKGKPEDPLKGVTFE